MASQPGKLAESIRLGDDVELDLRAYELRRSGRALKLERIPMELLLLLVEQKGELVSRDQILARIWGKDICIEADNSINAAVRKIRQVLKDDPERPRFVQTITGKGYRFIATVAEIGPVPASQEVSSNEPSPTESPIVKKAFSVSEPTVREKGSPVEAPDLRPTAGRSLYRRWQVLLGTAVVLSLVMGGYFQWSRSRAAAASGQRIMLAVLPFENLTGDVGEDYFSDGLTEEMIAQVGHLDPKRLGVIARSSVMHYKRSQQPLERIGHELGVQYVLEGSVRRDTERIRITAQLIQVQDRTHLWARQYDRKLSSLLAVQGEIAQQIAGEIQLTLGDRKLATSGGQPTLPPNTYEAYELYLRGRDFWNRRTPQSFRQAIECFQQAIAKDANYARAYAGLADSYALMTGYTLTPQNEFIPKARTAALKALELDPNLAEAHTSLAVIAQDYDWNWQTAEKEYRRAIELDPNYATGHHWYAEYLALHGRFDEAFVEIERARQLDPLSLIIAADKGAILYFSRDYDRAVQQLRAVLDIEPNFPRAHLLDFAYVQKGMFAEALDDVDKWRRINDTPWSWMMLSYTYGRAGDKARARVPLRQLQQLNRRRPVDLAPLFVAHIGIGDKEAALVWLEKAYLQHSPALTALKVDPIYDPLRSDPRFQDLLRRIGLAQ